MNVLTYWLDACKRVPEARTPADVTRYLQAAAADIANFLATSRAEGESARYRHEQWAAVGVDPVSATISSHGAAFSRGGRLRVIVKSKQSILRQRYTVAHEIGHVLLRQMMEQNFELKLPRKLEEELCDEFAAQVLVPDDALKKLMEECRSAPTARDLLKWCTKLQVNIQPMLIAARKHWRWGGAVLAYCENYAKAGSEETLRFVGFVADEKLFLPRHKRVASVGLLDVSAWFAESDEPYASGRQDDVRLPLYARDMHTRTGQAQGSVEWSAMRMKERADQGGSRALIDLRLVGDWSVRWAGGKAETFAVPKTTKGL